ncbi:hypothetical protein ABK040_016625 [Willaertia magna]
MVLLKLKQSDKDIFLIEEPHDSELNIVIRNVVNLYNLRIKLKLMITELERLRDKGPVLNSTNNEDCISTQLQVLSLKEEEEEENNNDEPKYAGPIKDENIVNTVNNVIMESKRVLSNEKAEQKIVTKQEDVEYCIKNVTGAVMMAFPAGLAEEDPMRDLLKDDFQCKEMFDPESATLWFAGKELTRDKKLMDYKSIGRNDKTMILVKLGKKGGSAPLREAPIDEEVQKKLLSYWHKKQEEQKKLLEDDDVSYSNSEWANPKGLKTQFQGISSTKWK